jgi:Cdc6-like AAA superfamily ATPase
MSEWQRRLRAWLDAPDPSTNLSKARRLHLKGSGQWFLDSAAFASWKAAPSGSLWLNGIPGCGKTIMSSTVIKKLQADDPRETGPLVYFFFSFAEDKKQTAEHCVRSLIDQLWREAPARSDDVEKLFHASNDGEKQPSWDALLSTLEALISRYRYVRIVLDALDECQDRKSLLPWLVRLISLENTQTIVTSRREHDITAALHECIPSKCTVPLQSATIADDIQAYVQDRLREGSGFKKIAKEHRIRNEIENTLIQKADGM